MRPELRRILIVSDAWHPQLNGVVRTLAMLAAELRALGREVEVIGPDRFCTLACPTYPEIRLALLPARRLARLIELFAPDALHIATEGPLGQAARRWALARGVGFTSSFHTRFPEYLALRLAVPLALTYRWMRRFHGVAAATLVATASLQAELARRGFRNLAPWSRGVDLALFRDAASFAPADDPWAGLARPVFLSVGRVSVEKNLPAFLSLDLPGTKVVVGDGPALPALRRRFPDVLFTGARHGTELARAYAAADVFVFPSRTDTFGLVLLESLACGTPVAAFPVTGPRDVLVPQAGVLDEDLRVAALRALPLDRSACRAHAERFSWRSCAERLLETLVPISRADA